MRAEAGAYPAMAANNRLFRILVEIYRAHDASFLASAAPDAHVFPDHHAASGPFLQGVARANLHTRGLRATEAHDGDEVAGHSTCRPHPDRAFYERVVFFVRNGADAHAGEATQALIHILWLKYF